MNIRHDRHGKFARKGGKKRRKRRNPRRRAAARKRRRNARGHFIKSKKRVSKHRSKHKRRPKHSR